MKIKRITIVSGILSGLFFLNSCDTPTGQGAAAGAGAGAIIGNIAGRGGARSTVIGAAIGRHDAQLLPGGCPPWGETASERGVELRGAVSAGREVR